MSVSGATVLVHVALLYTVLYIKVTKWNTSVIKTLCRALGLDWFCSRFSVCSGSLVSASLWSSLVRVSVLTHHRDTSLPFHFLMSLNTGFIRIHKPTEV